MSNWSPPPIWPHTPRRRQGIWNYPRPYRTGIRAWIPSWRFVVGSILTGTSLVAGVVISAWFDMDVPDELGSVHSETTTVLYADGKPLGKFAAENRTIVALADVPAHVPAAIIASEDQSFMTHMGINPLGIVRAALNNVTGGDQQGASTLTQQYVENYYIGVGEATYADKFREAILALKVTQEQSKEEVLEGYLNTIYLGRGAYGIEAASQAYFGHSAKEMTISESAFIAGIIPNPTYWDPRQGEDARAQAEARWNRTLDFMVEQGAISAQDRAGVQFPKLKKYTQGSGNAQSAYLLQEVAKELAREGISEDQLTKGGYTIKTTLDSKMQAAAAESMKLPEDADPRIRASLTSIDPATGAIKALYGGPDYAKYQTNAATQDIAQAGSTFKPFTLVAALEQNVSLYSRWDGTSPQEIEGYTNWNDETQEEEQATLTNFGTPPYGESYPNVTLLDATANSVNTAYVHLNKEVGPDATKDVATRAGIPETDAKGNEIVGSNLANVLGTASVHNIDIAHAYSTFAAQGIRTTPHLVQEVSDGDKLLFQGSTEATKAFEPEVMAATTYALEGVVEDGSGEPASHLVGPDGYTERPVAGKTGTSNSNRSAWFAGYVPQLATVVGMYQYDLESGQYMQITPFGEWKEMGLTGITGGSWPVTAWADYMAKATEGMDVEEFPEYEPPAPPSPTPSPTPSPSSSPSESAEVFTVLVPEGLIGQQYVAAASALAGVQLVPQQISVDSEEPVGTVLSLDPGEGTEVEVNSTVRVEVSNGSAAEEEEEETTTVPWGLTNQDQGDAEAALQDAELTPVVQEAPSDTVAEGRVISVDPGEGTEVPVGSEVTLVVSTGPEEGGGGDPSPDPSDDGGGIFG
ncbi:transglycosylase domain-containing protein [Promicromonospora sp. NPDC050880]|uniref:transglycosylase domain-containing protein n=1 Tax=Promicromonospora sp. NPDC050880 TaxID=3364406 RepID=UPI0037A3B677